MRTVAICRVIFSCRVGPLIWHAYDVVRAKNQQNCNKKSEESERRNSKYMKRAWQLLEFGSRISNDRLGNSVKSDTRIVWLRRQNKGFGSEAHEDNEKTVFHFICHRYSKIHILRGKINMCEKQK